ncbi:hypothetical protein HDE_00977 [Halotydeus destructor]|nr:hypothetical protein HDE_00977 [Halotydeus destructor]
MSRTVDQRFLGYDLKNIPCKAALYEIIDYASFWMRLDCLHADTLGSLATAYEAGVRIVSLELGDSANEDKATKMESDVERFEPMLDTLALVDRYSCYCFWAAIFAVALVASFDKYKRHSKFVLNIRQFSTAMWNVFKLVVNQAEVIHATTPVQIVWLLLTLGLFVIISGLFLNLLRTEKVAQRAPDQIETLGDIIGTKFNSVEPAILTNCFTYALSKIVSPNSDQDKLFKKLEGPQGHLVNLDANIANSGMNLDLLEGTVRRKDKYILFEEVLWIPLKPLLCNCAPSVATQVHVSGNTILDGLLITPYKIDLDYRLKAYLEYRLKNQFELGISSYDYFDIYPAIAVALSTWNQNLDNSTMCFLGMKDEIQAAEMQFQLRHSTLVLKFLATLLAMSLFIIFVEVQAKKRLTGSLYATKLRSAYRFDLIREFGVKQRK